VSIRDSRIILDTNVWVFGLRGDPEYHACSAVLENLSSLRIVIPRQVLIELQLNLSPQESQRFWRLITTYPARTEISWEPALPERVHHFRQGGCRRGDAAVAALAEHLRVEILVTENREFLRNAPHLPFRLMSSPELLAELTQESA
jgi:predicted nucleic acid-binding protein